MGCGVRHPQGGTVSTGGGKPPERRRKGCQICDGEWVHPSARDSQTPARAASVDQDPQTPGQAKPDSIDPTWNHCGKIEV